MQTQPQTDNHASGAAISAAEALARLNKISPVGDIAALRALPPETIISPAHLAGLGIMTLRYQEARRRASINPLPYRKLNGRAVYVAGDIVAWLDAEFDLPGRRAA